ncbi:probable E3 ubiquitin-protein ligase MID2 isoform X2 [Neoarius graeffei]|uniref:probable E3 ubiquitin-protein ligase MID2 isoform X2 n=1 Tax=Neoarius graeffei TaxID=443677 RepID=UPI00298C1821|nr:probable E3 ubiquitin-protein ligase MID2 isoform X2 [Neoarius graeffei]
MAMSVFRDGDQYNCSVCLDLMKDPVTIPCGHSYCMSCIEAYWSQDQIGTTRCPQCRHEFPTRPALNKNTMLAEILEDLRTTTSQSSRPTLAFAHRGEVECDFCTGVKLRAVRSCLECRAAYCETHLQPHYDFPALQRHKLIVATRIPMCPRHDRLLEAFCRTDNTCICMSCVVDEHKGHDTVSSAAERDQKQQSTQESVETTQLACSSLTMSIEKSCLEVIERIRAQEGIYKDRSLDLQEQLELEIAILMGQEELMDKLLQTEDHVYFLQNFESMPSPSGAEELPSQTFKPPVSFSDDVSNMVSEFKAKLEIFCKQELENMFAHFHIKVGDRVRVKSSVSTPKFNWGHIVTHESVGVVKYISEESVIIDFPEHKNWKGLLSEMERVTAPDESGTNPNNLAGRLGDKVRETRLRWFGQSSGPGDIEKRTLEMELPGISAQQREFKVGDRVRVKPSVNSPRHGWGGVTHECVGVVKSLDGETIAVDFPKQPRWRGVISEMEIVS